MTAPRDSGVDCDGRPEPPLDIYDNEDGAAVDNQRAPVPLWLEPEPITEIPDPEPYPSDALPTAVLDAVTEVQRFVQSPLPMAAASALAAVSVATQAQVDVERAKNLSGPTSLNFMTVADSGERKTTSDTFFTTAIRKYEEAQEVAMSPEIQDFRAALAAWEAKHEGLRNKIKQDAKASRSTNETEQKLKAHEREKPVSPRVPKLILGDETPEALAWRLAKEYPSAGLISSEAGVVLGAHGMGSDSIMRNLGFHNILWDGGSLSIGRRTKESFTVRGARLTVHLQVQGAALRAFLGKSGDLVRGIGFLARYLFSCPLSTQGTRSYREPPDEWPALARFNARITEILNLPVSIDETGSITPAMLTMTSDAKAAWIAFHDKIEAMLGANGELFDVRDFASKVADNCARLAGLFEVFEGNTHGPISVTNVEAAARIVAWHLNEARRLFGELALPTPKRNAIALEQWLISRLRDAGGTFVSRKDVQRLGPKPLRDGPSLDAAQRVLAERGRVRLIVRDNRKLIFVNPRLLSGDAD